MSATKRIDWIDVAKGFGMICVVLAHVEEQYLKLPLYTFHMPLFFFLSGYLFSIKSSFKEFFIGKCKRILVPYFCLGTLLILFDNYWHGKNPYGYPWFNQEYFKGSFISMLYQSRFLTLWFIACLFWLSMLCYVLVRFIKKEWLRAIIVIVLSIFAFGYYQKGGGGIFWNIDVCFTALPFFYAGFLCRKTDFVNKKILACKWKPLLFVAFIAIDVVCAILNLRLTGQHLEMFYNQYAFPPLTYLGAFAAIFAIIIFADFCRWAPVKLPLKYLGENSMLLYAWHQTMMMPVVREVFLKNGWFLIKSSTPFYMYFVKAFVTTFVVILLLCIINEIICRIKLGFLVGK